MLTWVFVLLAQAGAEPASVYAAQVQSAVLASASYLKTPGVPMTLPAAPAVAVVEVLVEPDGAVSTLRLAASTGQNKLDDVARAWVLAAEPLPPPDPTALGERSSLSCLVRVA